MGSKLKKWRTVDIYPSPPRLADKGLQGENPYDWIVLSLDMNAL